MGWARGRVSGIEVLWGGATVFDDDVVEQQSCTGSDTPWADGPAMLSYLFLNCCIY